MKFRRSRRGGSRVESVDPDGAAQMVGIEVEDLILQVEGSGRGNIEERIIGRYFQGDRDIELTIQRGETRKSVQLHLESPKVEQDSRIVANNRLPTKDTPSIKEQLVESMSSVEQRLDDHVALLTSTLYGENSVIQGLLLREDIVVSKSSCVGDAIRITWDRNRTTTGTVIARNQDLDLVVIRMAQPHRIPEPLVSLIPLEKSLGKLLVVPARMTKDMSESLARPYSRSLEGRGVVILESISIPKKVGSYSRKSCEVALPRKHNSKKATN